MGNIYWKSLDSGFLVIFVTMFILYLFFKEDYFYDFKFLSLCFFQGLFCFLENLLPNNFFSSFLYQLLTGNFFSTEYLYVTCKIYYKRIWKLNKEVKVTTFYSDKINKKNFSHFNVRWKLTFSFYLVSLLVSKSPYFIICVNTRYSTSKAE